MSQKKLNEYKIVFDLCVERGSFLCSGSRSGGGYYYNQTSFRDVYESVEDAVKSFYNGESKALNKNSCKGAERWLEEWRRLCENR